MPERSRALQVLWLAVRQGLCELLLEHVRKTPHVRIDHGLYRLRPCHFKLLEVGGRDDSGPGLALFLHLMSDLDVDGMLERPHGTEADVPGQPVHQDVDLVLHLLGTQPLLEVRVLLGRERVDPRRLVLEQDVQRHYELDDDRSGEVLLATPDALRELGRCHGRVVEQQHDLVGDLVRRCELFVPSVRHPVGLGQER